MKRILIFSTEPTEKDGRINRIKFSVLYGLSHTFINPLNVYISHGRFEFSRCFPQEQIDKRIGTITFQRIENYDQIKKLSDPKLIKSMIIVNNGTPVSLPNTIFFDCHFPISDIPLKDLQKFRIVNVS